MGCNIHVCREVRAKDGTWHAIMSANRYFEEKNEADPEYPTAPTTPYVYGIERDYQLFGILSEGLRCEMTPNLGESSFPGDASPQVLKESRIEDAKYSDWHSHGYATLGRLKELRASCGGNFTWHPHSVGEPKTCQVDDFLIGWARENLEPYAWDGDESVRIVFWFDN